MAFVSTPAKKKLHVSFSTSAVCHDFFFWFTIFELNPLKMDSNNNQIDEIEWKSFSLTHVKYPKGKKLIGFS